MIRLVLTVILANSGDCPSILGGTFTTAPGK
jgi:hypothetical protein